MEIMWQVYVIISLLILIVQDCRAQTDTVKIILPSKIALQAIRGVFGSEACKIQAAVLSGKIGALESIVAYNHTVISTQQKTIDRNLMELNKSELISSQYEREVKRLKKQSVFLKIALGLATSLATYHLIR